MDRLSIVADEEIDELCGRFGVRRLYLFGSATRPESFHQESDIDFLVEFEREDESGYADRFYDLALTLEKKLGRKVDLMTIRSLKNPYLRESIEKNRRLLYDRSHGS